MRLDLREVILVPGASKAFNCELETEGLDFPSVTAYTAKPHAAGRVYNEAGILRLEGTLSADMHCVCDRCGETYEMHKQTVLDAVIVEEENEEFPEYFVLDGYELDLDELLSTCFILDMETKFLCREDCKGLCARCGKNLNLGPCSCKAEVDPRFAVLEQLLDK